MQEFTLRLTLDQIRVIGMGLGEVPTKFGAPVATDINRQIAEQMPKPALVEDGAKKAS